MTRDCESLTLRPIAIAFVHVERYKRRIIATVHAGNAMEPPKVIRVVSVKRYYKRGYKKKCVKRLTDVTPYWSDVRRMVLPDDSINRTDEAYRRHSNDI